MQTGTYLDVGVGDVRGLVAAQVADGALAQDLRDAARRPLLVVALQ